MVTQEAVIGWFKVRINSNPVGVPVTVDETVVDGTPLTVEMSPATYVIVVPPTFKGLPFLKWEDESTDTTRIIEITEDKELTAYYKRRVPTALIIGGLIAALGGVAVGTVLIKKKRD